ncbi:hypothetical protein C1D62_24710 [Salmonella enterica]|nr:hypothetical protein [Salmonella enterica]
MSLCFSSFFQWGLFPARMNNLGNLSVYFTQLTLPEYFTNSGCAVIFIRGIIKFEILSFLLFISGSIFPACLTGNISFPELFEKLLHRFPVT